jgi:hypothetical protein
MILDGLVGYSRNAGFYWVKDTKTGENIPDDHKIYQMALKYAKWP